MSEELRMAIGAKRRELARRISDLRFLDRRLAHLSGQLADGDRPRNLITIGKEERHDLPM